LIIPPEILTPINHAIIAHQTAANLKLLSPILTLTVHHESDEHRQDSIVGGEVEAELHHIPDWVFDTDLERSQLHFP